MTSNKRLAKNTLLLYVRTILILGISLFTSRVILKTLGVDDYGIYNVIGGFVTMFSLVSGTLVHASQRFITFELGKPHDSRPQEVFGAVMTVHILLAVLLVLLLETVGLWYVNFKMNLPPDRMDASNWVFQFSVAVFIVNILSAPYNAVIIAHEKMSAFAYISLLEVTLKLLIVYLLLLSDKDRLIIYAALLLLVAFIIRFIYGLYCRRHFTESKFTIVREKKYYKEILGFVGYTFVGSMASVLSHQGVSLILNYFFGVVVNAARGLSMQVQNAIMKFVNDFMTALKPQITKSYASGEVKKSMDLCYMGSRFSFYLFLILSTPIVFRTPYVLSLWLGDYPDFTVEFVRLTIFISMANLLTMTLTTEILAIGDLKVNVWIIGGIRVMSLPLCYLFSKLGYGPLSCYYILLLTEFATVISRVFVIKWLIKIPVLDFFRHVMAYITCVGGITYAISFFLDNLFAENFSGFFMFTLSSAIITVIVSYFIGVKSDERMKINSFVVAKVSRYSSKTGRQ